MNMNLTSKERNQAARVTSQFLAEKGIEFKHSTALDLVARLSGHKNHMTAKSMEESAASTVNANITELLTQSSVQTAIYAIPEVASLYEACMHELAAGLPLDSLKRLELPFLLKAYQQLPTTAPIDSTSEGKGLTGKEYEFACRLSEAYSHRVRYLEMLRQRVRLQFELATYEGLSHRYGIDGMQTLVEINGLVEELNEEHGIAISLGDYVIYSITEEGYFNGSFGWVEDVMSATGYYQKSSAILEHLSLATRRQDLRWEEVLLEEIENHVS